jgi:transketolase
MINDNNKLDKMDLEKITKEIRKSIMHMAFKARSSHSGGCLSCVEILTILYFEIMNVDPKNPYKQTRDRLIFSKAHDCKALYAVLAERGFFNKNLLDTYETDGGLPGHSTRHCLPGIEVSAGALGHGLSIAAGIAYVGKIKKEKHKVFAVLSDGECDEGSTWEAVLFAGHHKLNNLVAVIDYNKLQAFGRTEEVLDLEPFSKKWESFNWIVEEVDGHNLVKLSSIFKNLSYESNKPLVIIAHTIKGQGGIEKYADKVESHYKSPLEEEYREVIKKLDY